MFLGWGHTGPIRLWSSKSRPQQKLLTALVHSFASPYIPCAGAERWDPPQPGNFGRPLGQSAAPSESGGPPRIPPPSHTPTPTTTSALLRVRPFVHTQTCTRVSSRSGAGSPGVLAGGKGILGRGVVGGRWGRGCLAHPECLGRGAGCGWAGWGQAMWHVALWGSQCHATPGAAPSVCLGGWFQGAANTSDPPHPVTHPGLPNTPPGPWGSGTKLLSPAQRPRAVAPGTPSIPRVRSPDPPTPSNTPKHPKKPQNSPQNHSLPFFSSFLSISPLSLPPRRGSRPPRSPRLARLHGRFHI